MALAYLLSPTFQIENTAGKPASGGHLEVYIAGSREKYYCASDFEGTLHPFQIPLDSLGSSIVLADDSQAYDVYVYNRYGGQMMSRYNVTPISVGGGGGGGYVSGAGINITGSTISVDFDDVQAKLTAGTGITIDGDNVISSDGGNVFVAEYGTTTYAEISDARQAGKAVFLTGVTGLANAVMPMTTLVANPAMAIFGTVVGITEYTAKIDQGTWSVSSALTQADWAESYPLAPSYIENKPAEKSLVAGSNISITEGDDSITIAASGSSLPSYTSSDQYKVLSVSYNGTGTEWRDVSEVPSYAAVDQGKLLGVINNGGNIELGWTQPIGYWTQAVDISGNRTITAEDISTGYIDFEGTIIASDTSAAITDPTYAALTWDVQVTSGPTANAVSSIDFALGVSGGSYNTLFSDSSPAHDVHKDWGMTSAWMLNYRSNRVRARCHLASGATVGDTLYMYGGGIVMQVR